MERGTSSLAVRGLVTWAATAIALLFGVTMSYVPYEFQGPGYELVYPQIRLLGLLFGLSGVLLLLPRLFPELGRWLDPFARLLFDAALAWLWARFAVAAGYLVSAISLGLLLPAVLLEPILDRRGISTFRWYLAAVSLALGLTMIVAPTAFSPAIYSFLAADVRPFGVLLVLSGFGLIATDRQASAAPLRVLPEIATGVLFLALAASAVETRRLVGLETFLVLGMLALTLPFWPRLSSPPRLANRLTRAFVLAVLVPLLVLGAATSYFVQQTLQQQVFAANAAIARGAADLVRQYVLDGESAADVVAQEPATVAATAIWDTSALEGQIRVPYEASDLFRGVLLLDASGTVRVVYPPRPALIGTSLASTQYFREVMRYGEPVTGLAFKSALAGQPLVVPYAVPIQGANGQTLGVMVALIDLGELSGRVATISVGQTGRIRLVDQAGQIIASSNPAELGQQIAPTDVAAQRALAGKSGVMEVVDPQGTRQLAAYEYVPDLGWALVAELPTSEAYRPITTLTGILIIILAGAALAAIGTAVIVSRRITRPLRGLREAAEALSRGDLARRVRITTGDELESLGNSFNDMAEQLQRREAEVLGLLAREEALAQIAQALVRELELGRVVDVVLDQSLLSLGVDAVLLWLADPKRRTLTLLAYRNVSPQSVELVRQLSYDAPMLSARAAKTGQVQVVEDVQAVMGELAITRQLYALEETRSLLAVPLPSRGRLVGVVTYTTRRPRHFSESDLEFNAAVASLFAVAIDHAQLYDEVRQSLRLREEFMSAAAHELKTPVTTIKGLSEQLLRRERHELGERKLLETIDRQTDRVNRVVEDLVAVVRLQPGFLVLRRERFDLSLLVQAQVEHIARSEERFHFTVAARDTLVVDADRQLISDVIRHLLGNAMRYSSPGGTIEVEAKRSDGEALVAVRDHGVGIPPERQPHVFEPFYEPLPSGVPGYVGIVSLGLYLGKRTTEAHGGRIWFESTPGKGSVFYFSLPLAEGDSRIETSPL